MKLLPPCTVKPYSLQREPELCVAPFSFTVHPLWNKVLLETLLINELVKKFLLGLPDVTYYYQTPMNEGQRLLWKPNFHLRVQDSSPSTQSWIRFKE
jgi:hypothetical protein